MKRPVPVRVNEYVKKHPEAYDLSVYDVNEIRKLGDAIDIVCTAFAYGYMKGHEKAKKGVAVRTRKNIAQTTSQKW